MPRNLATSALIKPFVVLALPGMYLFYKYNQYKRQQQEQTRRKVTERELAHLNHKIDKLLCKLEENEPEMATSQEDECVICVNARATMQTFPCSHRVVCRKCFVKTIQMAVSQRLLPLRCVICRSKILRLKQGVSGGVVLPTSASQYCMQGPSGSSGNKWDVPASASLYSMSSGASSLSGKDATKIINESKFKQKQNSQCDRYGARPISTQAPRFSEWVLRPPVERMWRQTKYRNVIGLRPESEQTEARDLGTNVEIKVSNDTIVNISNVARPIANFPNEINTPDEGENEEESDDFFTDRMHNQCEEEKARILQLIGERNSLQSTLENVTTQYEKKINELQSQLSDCHNKNAALQEKISQLKSKIRKNSRNERGSEIVGEPKPEAKSRARRQSKDVTLRLEEFRTREERLKSTFKNLDSKKSDIESETKDALQELWDLIAEKNKVILSLRADLDRAKSECDSAAEHVRQLEHELRGTSDELQKRKEKVDRLMKESEVLCDQISGLEMELRELKAANEEQGKTNKKLAADLKSAKSTARTSERTVAELQTRAADREKELSDQISALQHEYKQGRHELDRVRREFAAERNQWQERNAEHRRQSMLQLESVESEREKNEMDLKLKLDLAESMKENLSTELADLKERYKVAKRVFAEREAHLNGLLDRSREKEQSLLAELTSLKQDCAQLKRSLDTAQRTADEINSQFAQSRRESSVQIESLKSQSQTKLEELTSKLKAAETERNDLTNQINELKMSYATIQTELEAEQAQLREQQTQSNVRESSMLQEIEKLKQKCDDYRKELGTSHRDSETQASDLQQLLADTQRQSVAERTRTRDIITDLKSKHRDSELKIVDLETELERTNGKLKGDGEELREREIQIKKLELKVAEREQEIDKLRSLCEQTKKDLDRFISVDSRNQEMEVNLRIQSSDTIANLQAEILDLKLKLQSSEAVVATLNSEISELQNQNQSTLRKLESLKNVQKENDKVLHEKSLENANFKIELAELKQTLKEYEDISPSSLVTRQLEESECSLSVLEERTKVTTRYKQEMQPLLVHFNTRTHNVTKVTVNHNLKETND